jgi:hypothetical protein
MISLQLSCQSNNWSIVFTSSMESWNGVPPGTGSKRTLGDEGEAKEPSSILGRDGMFTGAELPNTEEYPLDPVQKIHF